jgi:hypothetical protein
MFESSDYKKERKHFPIALKFSKIEKKISKYLNRSYIKLKFQK